MLCKNCGHQINENKFICSNCGKKIIIGQNNYEKTHNKKSKLLIENTIKYKKILIIIFLIIILSIFGCILFYKLYGFDKLSWDETYSDIKLEYVSPTNIKLGIKFNNKEKIDDIKYNVTCGDLNKNGLELDWNLKDSIDKCEITVSYKLRKISKIFKIINYNINENDLVLDYQIDLDSEEDLDLDGLTNKQEKEYKTNPLLLDTDMDGLNDYEEIFIYKTNPNKKDTDDDELNDSDEIKLKFNPLKSDSLDDGLNDGKRNITYNYNFDNVNLKINGVGNISSTVVEINSNTKISNKKGLIDKLYTFYTDGKMKDAILTIKYDKNDLIKYGLNEDKLSIYYFDELEAKYEKISTLVDKKNKTLTAHLNHFSNYVVGDTSIVKENNTNEILFILDNSWSMYTNEQYKELTGNDYGVDKYGNTKLAGSDSSGIRFTLTSDLINKLDNKFQIGLSEFRSDYKNALKIGSSKEELQNKLNTMNGNFITNIAGTNITYALTNGIKEFSKDSDNKYIVILTDGQDYTLKLNTKKILASALENNVKICSIGFGDSSYNEGLSNISSGTGCKFYSSGNVNGLKELFDNIDSEINDNLIDIDGDNKFDGILIADSGFIVNRDGFSFGNYGTNLSIGGHCYGMATFAQLYYKKKLPLKVNSITSENKTSFSYDLTNTYFKNYGNLYDYKLQTNALKYSFGFELFGEEIPSDLRTLSGNKLTLNEPYKREIIDSKLYEIKEEKATLSKEQQLQRWGVNYELSDNYYLNENMMQTSEMISNDDKQLLNAIYAGFIKQHSISNYSSGMDYILWLRNILGTDDIAYSGSKGFINILKTRLNDSDAPVISSDFSSGLHAINAISLVQDIDNPNYYYIGVYDNNYPGEKRYVDIKCNEKSCLTVANKYYSKSDQPIRITASLEQDLNYYEKYILK